MLGFWTTKELCELEGNLSLLFSNPQFKDELTLILLSGLSQLGFNKTKSALEEESGMKLPTAFGNDFKEFVMQGRFDQALGNTFKLRFIGEIR